MILFDSYTVAKSFLNGDNEIDYENSFGLAKFCSSLLSEHQEEGKARDLIIRVRDKWDRLHESTKPIWNDLTEAAGLYPYLESEPISKSAQLRYEYHKSPHLKHVYLHEEQQMLSLELLNKRSVVLSAPTSFGKSLLIEEIVASNIYKQIVIIQPTLALLDETRKKLLKYRESYKVIVSTNQEPDKQKGNIFLFTGERVVEYKKFPKIEFFVIDEFYKLSLDRDDDRAISLNQAFHKLLKFTNRFYLLGPMIKNIPSKFQNKFELTWFRTEFATVSVNEKNLDINNARTQKERNELKKEALYELLKRKKEQTLIYCSSPDRATTLSLEFLKYLQKKDNSRRTIRRKNIEIIEWISENVNPLWSLSNALRYKAAFHHGALPRHLGSSIVDAFNIGAIRWLFCTSTLIEGVNTTAKNVILFDKKKGTKQIDFFDYKNIAGRSGRLKEHYIGNVYRFEKEPQQMELFVDIPLFNQEKAPIEILVSMDEKDLESAAKDRLKNFTNLPQNLKAVLRKNSGVNIDAQLNIITELENGLPINRDLLVWKSYPTYEQLNYVLELCWKHLLKSGENKAGVRSFKQLSVLTLKYIRFKSVSAIIREEARTPYWKEQYPDKQERIDKLSFYILNVVRHWFDYKLPKWLSVISELQEYVLKTRKYPYGNYSFIATSLEHGFLPSSLAALMEYDIPLSAIRKLKSLLDDENTPEYLINSLNKMSDIELMRKGLIQYEINKLRNSL